VASKQAGLFKINQPGEYTVSIDVPGCGFFTAKTTIGDALTVNPEMHTYISNAVIGGICTTVYQLVIDPKDGPYMLTGGPNNISLLIDESFLIGNCRWYSVSSLLPGQYQLSPLSNCGVKSINLPKPDFNLQATPAGNCPGSGTITATGANNLAWWEAWGLANDATINWPGGLIDRYSLDVNNNGNNAALSGSPYTFGNVAPGPHTVYLYTFNSGCPIDTFEVVVPDAEPLKIDASSGILCDGQNSTSLVLEMLSGKAPFVIEQLDCENLGDVVATFTTNEFEFEFPGVTQGDYCFRVLDSCVISLDHQFSVKYYQDEVDIYFNCDNTVTFHVDSINAKFTWVTTDGAVVGNSHQLTLPNNTPGEVYTVLVDIGTCVISRQVTMPDVKIVPTVSIAGKPYFCEGDTVLLTAVSDADSFLWNVGASQTVTFAAAAAGVYSVTVTNDFGCSATADFELKLNQPEVDIAVLSGGNGYGLKCFGDSDGVLLAQPVAGFAPFSFTWSNTAQSQKITNLPAGEYSVTITDSLGCVGEKTLMLTEPDLFVPHISPKRPLCYGDEDGLIDIAGWSGGAGIVNASLNGSLPVLVPVKFKYLLPGEFTLEIWDGNGCRADTAFSFPEPQELLLDLGEDLDIELGDSIRLEPFLNFWPVDSFLWRTNDASPIHELSAWCAPVENVYYQLQVWDESGCMVEDKILVKVDQKRRVYVPNAFSPNGDGVNDFFTIYVRSSAVRSIRSFQVFSRWGERVFDRTEFQPNNDQLGWNGSLDGRYVMPGVYVWKAEIEFVDGKVEVMTGDVMVMR
jgi:gliding motility-associated-like protein